MHEKSSAVRQAFHAGGMASAKTLDRKSYNRLAIELAFQLVPGFANLRRQLKIAVKSLRSAMPADNSTVCPERVRIDTVLMVRGLRGPCGGGG
jgi:hypothetical protein